MDNIYLTGFMCSGKTTTAVCLGELLGRKVFDTDKMLEEKTNMKISDIFSRFGEEYFREKETEILLSASKSDNAIISTGGGIVLKKENIEIMRSTGKIVALIPDFSVLETRILSSNGERPLLNDAIDNIKKRYENRLPFYKACDLEVNPSREATPMEIAKEILKGI